MARSIASPIQAITHAMDRLARYEMETEIVGVNRKDEVGAMAQAVLVFRDSMVRADQLAADQEATKARAAADQKVAMALGDYASLASLGVPTLPSDDGPSGVRAAGTTSLPSAQTLAATFDRALARAYGETIGAEARGKAFNWWLGPAMDIARTPLAGRQPENLGEDPFLAGETVAQEVTGAKSAHVIATLERWLRSEIARP